MRVRICVGLIVTEEVSITAGHPLAAAMVFVTVYVPGKLADKSISPVVALMTNPAGAEVKVPATPPPRKLGAGSTPL